MSPIKTEICKFCEGNCFYGHMLSVADKTAFLKDMVKIQYHKKETIIKQNSHCDYVLFLKNGMVKIFTERRNDKNIILRVVPSQNFIGLPTVVSGIYNYSAVALRESEVCLLPIENFMKIIESNVGFAKEIFNYQSRLTLFFIEKLSSLGTKQMHGRLADIITYLCSNEFKDENVFEYITRKDIAELAGMSSESAIRLLTEFKNDGLIKLNGKKIEINNKELLNRLSDIG
jgi:CRP-like cAMP-binding protein